MAWSLFCLLLTMSYCSGSLAQYVLIQPPSISVSLGETAQITCSGDLVNKKYVQWIQQRPNNAPQLVIYKDKERPDHVSDRFSGNSSSNTATLTITNIQLQDEADYYCEHFHDNTSSQHSGAYRRETRQKPPQSSTGSAATSPSCVSAH
ncbi:UNVERIFIED_CONTAM: hypothetical protein K2H54_021554 [Gekko kuhli]